MTMRCDWCTRDITKFEEYFQTPDLMHFHSACAGRAIEEFIAWKDGKGEGTLKLADVIDIRTFLRAHD